MSLKKRNTFVRIAGWGLILGGIVANEWLLARIFSPDGNFLASASQDGTVMVWTVDTQSLIDLTCNRVGRNFLPLEWAQYFPGEEYRITCPQWPAGQ